jgi:hypothetical protein
MNWRAGGWALLGAAVGGTTGILLGRASARRLLPSHNGHKHQEFHVQAMLVGASLGAIVGASLASDDPKKTVTTSSSGPSITTTTS